VAAEHPWLAAMLDVAMRPMYPARRLVVPLASGEVLEIGVGTGLNLALYDASRVRRVTALDPDPHMLRHARERVGVAPVPVDLVQAAAERIPCADARFDTVLVTWTLCTVENPGATLDEVRRVLRPGGRLVFIEHTRSVQPALARAQRRAHAGLAAAPRRMPPRSARGRSRACERSRRARRRRRRPERWTLLPIYEGTAVKT
jgi:ubiquinone/menaquinone biosynthesis C-methylase UbiE